MLIQTTDGGRLHALAVAAACGNLAELSELLATGVPLNKFFEGHCPPRLQGGAFRGSTFPDSTALHLAVLGGHVRATKMLLDAGCCVNWVDRSFRTPLMYAVMLNEVPMAGLLVEEGALLGVFDSNDRTALHLAAAHLDTGMASFLLDAGANVDAFRVPSGSIVADTVLFTAFAFGNEVLLRFLLDYGADFTEAHGDPDAALTVLAREQLANSLPSSTNLSTIAIASIRSSLKDARIYQMFLAEPARREEFRLAKCVAFAMGYHPHLGQTSRVIDLDAGVVKMILLNL